MSRLELYENEQLKYEICFRSSFKIIHTLRNEPARN